MPLILVFATLTKQNENPFCFIVIYMVGKYCRQLPVMVMIISTNKELGLSPT